eukprot:CAMPEP_0181431020 /NCGR_PEP_ID=MMETSP1110-20121109/18027_1 /TAXON_ID=174948 /ORGANISM="Symbiodinium sp., Strain CCMP421" /LENGTH=115 /DNA_ID=CAMNT_0023554361 /DNA_START=132 /DNA_END=479 /DNA_ORIENTATION=+
MTHQDPPKQAKISEVAHHGASSAVTGSCGFSRACARLDIQLEIPQQQVGSPWLGLDGRFGALSVTGGRMSGTASLFIAGDEIGGAQHRQAMTIPSSMITPETSPGVTSCSSTKSR